MTARAEPATTVTLTARPAAPPLLSSLRCDWQTPSDEADFALPVITDTAGSVGVVWGPTGVQNWLEPPTGLPSPIGLLYRFEDGRPVRVEPAGTSYRWSPWEIRRRHRVVSSTVRLHWDQPAITERLSFAEPGRYALLFGGLCRAWSFAHYWNLPPQDVPQFSVTQRDGSVLVGDNKTFGLAAFTVHADAPRIAVYSDLDAFLGSAPPTDRGRVAAVIFDVAAGGEVTWVGVQGSEPDPLPPRPDDTAEQRWEKLWQNTFRPGNDEFTGSLPALTFDDSDLDRLYYLAVLSLLSGRRRHRRPTARDRYATGGQAILAEDSEPLPVGWTTGATEGAATTSFLWELSLVAPLLARLDPDVLRTQLELFLAADVRRHWGIDLLSGQPVGIWYAINDTAIVVAAASYLQESGDRDWLDRTLPDGVTVRDQLLIHVRRHAELSGEHPLADYGPAENLLECVATYRHRVASVNAMAAWCYRFAAAELDPEQSESLLGAAERIEAAVLAACDADGVFGCGAGDDQGRGSRVRTVLDLIYVGNYLGPRVPAEVRRSMLGLLHRELITDDWMRALSLTDPASMSEQLPDFQAFRADHQSTGSYDAWPAMAASVRAAWGEADETLNWLRRISGLTREGPFGQAHWIGTSAPAPARKASFVNGNCYLEVCGSRFAVTLLELAGQIARP